MSLKSALASREEKEVGGETWIAEDNICVLGKNTSSEKLGSALKERWREIAEDKG
jgi:hypothetical protein